MKMKKNMKLISFIIIIFLVLNSHYSCWAANNEADNELDTRITSDSFVTGLNPNGLSGTAEKLSTPLVKFIKKVTNPILGFIQIVGAILTVVSVAIFGFGLLLTGNEGIAQELGLHMMGQRGGPEAKMELIKFGRTMLIGSVLLFCSSSLVKFVFYAFSI